jgi:hypothetical protein
MKIERFIELMKTDKLFWCLDGTTIRNYSYKYSNISISKENEYYDIFSEMPIDKVYETKEEVANILIDKIKRTYLNNIVE